MKRYLQVIHAMEKEKFYITKWALFNHDPANLISELGSNGLLNITLQACYK